jgi:hypothetical protein
MSRVVPLVNWNEEIELCGVVSSKGQKIMPTIIMMNRDH